MFMLVFCLVLCSDFAFATTELFEKKPKIVALVPGHNDARFLPNCFRALALYVDAIVYLDDASTDNSLEIAYALQDECHIEQIICKKEWIRHASADRNILLYAGRAIGGTHFVVLDADELFTANCTDANFLKNIILNLKPGERLCMSWIQLWRSTEYYRNDSSVWTHNYRDIAFCDDGICAYAPRFLFESRTPTNLDGVSWFVEGYQHGILHFQFVNFENLLRKQAWYRCMERIYNEKRTIQSINTEYFPSKDESNLGLLPAHEEWFTNYHHFFDKTITNSKEQWREDDVMRWFKTYGLLRFAGLDIWDITWPFEDYTEGRSEHFLDVFVFTGMKHGKLLEIGKSSNQVVAWLKRERNWASQTMYGDPITYDIDLIMVHEMRDTLCLINLDSYHVKTVCVAKSLLNKELIEWFQRYHFAQIGYSDQNYYYFLKMSYVE